MSDERERLDYPELERLAVLAFPAKERLRVRVRIYAWFQFF